MNEDQFVEMLRDKQLLKAEGGLISEDMARNLFQTSKVSSEDTVIDMGGFSKSLAEMGNQLGLGLSTEALDTRQGELRGLRTRSPELCLVL